MVAVARSIETMADGLRNALASEDFTKAHRYIDRLKTIILEGVLRNDPNAIQSAGSALQSCGEFIELSKRIHMKMDEHAVAWQLRADVATALLAQRIRPGRSLAEGEMEEGVSDLLLRILQDSDEALTNSQLAARADRDP